MKPNTIEFRYGKSSFAVPFRVSRWKRKGFFRCSVLVARRTDEQFKLREEPNWGETIWKLNFKLRRKEKKVQRQAKARERPPPTRLSVYSLAFPFPFRASFFIRRIREVQTVQVWSQQWRRKFSLRRWKVAKSAEKLSKLPWCKVFKVFLVRRLHRGPVKVDPGAQLSVFFGERKKVVQKVFFSLFLCALEKRRSETLELNEMEKCENSQTLKRWWFRQQTEYRAII